MATQQAATRQAPIKAERSAVPTSRSAGLAATGISALVIIPCFWQSRIQAGDLSSHVYNVWLANGIKAGKLPGLTIVSQWTNVLFDVFLGKAVQATGYALGQKLAVAAAVLVFFWSAFGFVTVVSERRPWHMMLPLAVFTYGWVFHMGFFNYYISAAFSIAALAVCWHGPNRKSLFAVPLLALGTLAHALPVAWAVGAILYVWLSGALRNRAPFATFAIAFASTVGLSLVLTKRFQTRHSLQQVFAAAGADQVVVFGTKYVVICIALLLFWFALWRDLRKRFGYSQILASQSFQLFAITVATIVILPTAVLLPGYEHGLMYIADRMSLIIGVLVCAMLGRAVPTKPQRVFIACIVLLFFGWTFRETARANAVESKISAALLQVPQGSRVLSSFQDSQSRVNPLSHAVDRACIGRCFSYGNYEPSTKQFRIRATAPNPYVASAYIDADAIQNGNYRVQPQDPPVFQIAWCKGDQEICIQPLAAGVMNGTGKP